MVLVKSDTLAFRLVLSFVCLSYYIVYIILYVLYVIFLLSSILGVSLSSPYIVQFLSDWTHY